MDKYILIKFFRGEASVHEVDSIIEWIKKAPENEAYFAQLKALYTISQEEGEIVKTLENKSKSSMQLIALAKQSVVPAKFFYISTAAAIVALFFIASLLLTNTKPLELQYENAVAMKQDAFIQTLYTEKGVKGFIVLPDSSKVWLNSDSKIIYPSQFTGKTRNVKISGEAYFEVTKDSLHPMIVSTNKDFSIEVLGTSFTVKSYPDDAKAEATLYKGAITMHYKNMNNTQIETLALQPNESFVYFDKSATPQQINYREPEKQRAWTKGVLIFDNTPMSEVFKILERWHGTQFIITNKNLDKYTLSAEFSSESIIQIMEIIQMITPIKYTILNNSVTIR